MKLRTVGLPGSRGRSLWKNHFWNIPLSFPTTQAPSVCCSSSAWSPGAEGPGAPGANRPVVRP